MKEDKRRRGGRGTGRGKTGNEINKNHKKVGPEGKAQLYVK